VLEKENRELARVAGLQADRIGHYALETAASRVFSRRRARRH
jgi:hypothetical protein